MAAGPQTENFDRSMTDDQAEYRALSTGAVASFMLGLASVITIPAGSTSIEAYLIVSPVPLLGLFLGLRSYFRIRRTPEELIGSNWAALGSALSLCMLVGGLAFASYVYATEVPEGYARLSFTEMKPDDRQQSEGTVVPPEVLEMHGKQIFIKGFMRPPSQRFHLDSFLLVRDNNECCFGKNMPAYFDRVLVHMIPPLRTDYSTRMYRMAGTLHINPAAAGPNSEEPVFTLTADYLK